MLTVKHVLRPCFPPREAYGSVCVLPSLVYHGFLNSTTTYLKIFIVRLSKIETLLCGVPTSTMMMLKRSDIYDMIGEENYYWSVEKAILHKENSD